MDGCSYGAHAPFARVDNASTRLHLSGTYNPFTDSNRWTAAVLPVPVNAQLLAGDTLAFRMYSHNTQPRISMGFSDGANSDWYCNSCYSPTSGQSDAWVNSALPVGGTVSSPSQMAGKTINYLFVENAQGGPNGVFDLLLQDLVLIHKDGTVVPAPIPDGVIPSGGDTTDVANLKAVEETVPVGSVLAAAFGDTHYFLDDRLGSVQIELGTGGWPLSLSETTP